MSKKNFEDIVILISEDNKIRIESFPDYGMSTTELVKKLRDVANRLEKEGP